MASRRGLLLDEHTIDHFVPSLAFRDGKKVRERGELSFGRITRADVDRASSRSFTRANVRAAASDRAADTATSPHMRRRRTRLVGAGELEHREVRAAVVSTVPSQRTRSRADRLAGFRAMGLDGVVDSASLGSISRYSQVEAASAV